MKPVRIHLRIDELVLEGFSPLEGRRIADALEAELTRLLAAHEIPLSLARRAAISSIDAGELRITPGAAARQIGHSLAASLYRGLKQ